MKHAAKYLLIVGLFAIAMAYIESAVVVYLRALYNIENLLKDTPLISDQYTMIEIGREAATLIMLAVIGWITGKNRQERIGYAVFAFGIWDIFYYVWLYIFIGWPKSLFDWDILFLIPLPWWGPVLSPLLIALIMVISGGFSVLKSVQGKVLFINPLDKVILFTSTALILYSFMYDAINVLPNGLNAVASIRPISFNWFIYLIALSGIIFLLIRVFVIKHKK